MLKLFLMGALLGLVQGLVAILNYLYAPYLAGRPYYVQR